MAKKTKDDVKNRRKFMLGAAAGTAAAVTAQDSTA
jgi:hypothetical protein